jgi:YegS/Rv2252/BmrU family lipid kinase
VNPESQNGATGRRWRDTEKRLKAALGSFEVEFTRAPRDAERLAREAARAGTGRIVIAGGDGTLSEVANGLLGADLARCTEIGLLPLGSGGDFSRGFGLPRSLDAAVACLDSGRTRSVDACRVSFLAPSGDTRIRHCVNVASFGLSGLVSQIVNASSKRLGGRASFLIGALRAMVRYRGADVSLRVDGKLVHDGPISMVAAANGQSFGGGMRIAPGASVDDGMLDVVVVPCRSVPQLIANLPSLYRGTHLERSMAALHRGRVVEANATSEGVLIELDGEVVGTLPARIEILPGALTMLCPAP